jgi:hypothetical protein
VHFCATGTAAGISLFHSIPPTMGVAVAVGAAFIRLVCGALTAPG